MARLPKRAFAQYVPSFCIQLDAHIRLLAVRAAGFRHSTRDLHTGTQKGHTLGWPTKQPCAYMLDRQGQLTPR
jgi:hypothetical protein